MPPAGYHDASLRVAPDLDPRAQVIEENDGKAAEADNGVEVVAQEHQVLSCDDGAATTPLSKPSTIVRPSPGPRGLVVSKPRPRVPGTSRAFCALEPMGPVKNVVFVGAAPSGRGER